MSSSVMTVDEFNSESVEIQKIVSLIWIKIHKGFFDILQKKYLRGDKNRAYIYKIKCDELE